MVLTTSIIAVLIAGFGSYIAYQQYKINKQVAHTNSQKVKWDLFEKRYKVYIEVKNVLQYVTQHSSIEIDQLREFNFSTRERVFLFDKDINEFIESLIKKAIEITNTEKQIKTEGSFLMNNSAQWNALCQENSDLARFFAYEYQENVESRFLNYLDFRRL